MAQRSKVPKFGNWEAEENVPYTEYFEKARKGKTGEKSVNPSNPQENPDAFSDDVPPVHAPPIITASEPEVPTPAEVAALKPKHERSTSKDDSESIHTSDSPARPDIVGRRAIPEYPHQRHGDRGVNSGDPPRRANRVSGGYDRSTEQSPLHPNHQARAASKGGVSSPAWERKGSSEGSHGLAPNTPVRSRLRPTTRGDETPEKGAAVPKFGEWDENNPSSADGYTQLFNKVREEKQIGAAKVPVMPTNSSYPNGDKQENTQDSGPMMCGCFSWRRS
ncbi:RPM1-interacting protein 4-like [Tasmannia lanceolata]|uniref:RPM1-interacting protein 4-like n=1 Tax=Tasmannia lanceolata TaxID=3420 RepID=UPI0040635C02